MSNLFVMLSRPVTLEDLGLDSLAELRESAEEFGCNVIQLGQLSGQFMFSSSRYQSLMNLANIHEDYRGVILEVSKIYM